MTHATSWDLREGHALEQLRELDAGSVQACITSPPYYGLRDYELPPSLWGDGWEGCLGLEPTAEQFVAHLVEVFAEVRRVLRDDGVLWLNLGDSYASHGGERGSKKGPSLGGTAQGLRGTPRGHRLVRGDAKVKDLLGIPWMTAFALRADGWYLRSDVIWSKPNPMPESVLDRPTSAHEHVFLLAKSELYYYDAEAIKEADTGRASGNGFARAARRSLTDRSGREAGSANEWIGGRGRNRRSVWEVATQPYPGAHFATFPPKLIEPMVLAGSAAQACSSCGAPWERIVERSRSFESGSGRAGRVPTGKGLYQQGGGDVRMGPVLTTKTLGFKPTCDHADGGGHSVILDPFAGTGTTMQVAVSHRRDAIGIELSPQYAEQARRRMAGVTTGLFSL